MIPTADRRLFRWLNAGAGRSADAFFTGITELGSIWASVAATAVLSAMGRRRQALDALAAAGATWALGQGAKKLVRRARPYQTLTDTRLLVAEPRGSSWPSSHPAVLLAFLTVATRNLGSHATVRRGTALLATAVGASRVYVGVHYPSDVAGGLLIGRAVGALWSALVSPRTLARAGGAAGTVRP